ncbi:MAG: glutamate--tRNA ligase [Acidobacteriota bacterium]|nr:glutamate--tRNA ligase [Acidobacteriota bacterium]
MDDKLIVRFAPSPTGFLHLGSARTALFNWLAARSRGGRFLLRIEDTDKVRSEERFLDEILEDLRWLGLDWDGEPIRQSARFDLYRAKAEELVARGRAYREGEAVLFRVEPGRTLAYDDLIHGRIAVETENIKDQVLIKSDGSPAYNFCCVVDDAEQGVTHILRGDDHISNTPKQILFYEAFGFPQPHFGHMPLILGPDGSKLSKRHGGVSVTEYKAEGFLPAALANYLILLGWTPPGEREILSLQETAEIFRIEDMSGVQAKFDVQKLKWMNGEYILKLPAAEYAARITAQLRSDGLDPDHVPAERLAQAAELYRVRIKTLREFGPLADFFFRDDFAVDEEGQAKHLGTAEGKAALALFADRLAGLDEWRHDTIEALCRELAQEKGLKPAALIHPARMAVSGKTKGAGLFEIMELLGRETVLRRMKEPLT